MADERATDRFEAPAEVLAPAASGPARVLETRAGRRWAEAPATYALLGINVAVFAAMLAGGVSLTSPRPEQLLHWGADFGPAVLLGNEWWRLVSSAFVHVGLLHLATNMWCLWNLGLLGEPLLGAGGLVAVYVLTGAAGNLLSVAAHPGLANDGAGAAVGAGASGAIFGLAGALIVLLKSSWLPLPPTERKKLRRNVISFAVLNFALAFGVDIGHFAVQFDNMAHLGGFLAGLLLALPMVPRIGAPRTLFLRRRALALGAEAFLLGLLCVGVRAFYVSGVQGR